MFLSGKYFLSGKMFLPLETLYRVNTLFTFTSFGEKIFTLTSKFLPHPYKLVVRLGANQVYYHRADGVD